MSSAGRDDRWERTAATGRAVRDRLPLTDDTMVWGVALAVTLALVLRLLFLGNRVAHYDEGRVAYWSLHTLDTGHFAYRRIIHGPLLQHLDRYLFGLVGASDFVMRLPVALVGALLPASAFLFRKHLRRTEVVAMAFVLALSPVLLYYSRFMRSDLLVATFMFVALGFIVRYYDSRNHRYLYAATAVGMLGFGAKENAIVYVLTWIGAAVLLADQALYRPREYDSGVHLLWAKATASYRHFRHDRVAPWAENVESARDRLGGGQAGEGRTGDGSGDGSGDGRSVRTSDTSTATVVLRSLAPLRFAWYAIAIALIAFAVFLFVYAPRGAGYAGLTYPLGDASAHVGLWDAVGDPTKLPALFDATWSRFVDGFSAWFTGASEKEDLIGTWISYGGQFLRVLGLYAAPLTAFAVFGFLVERYGAAKTRNLVMFAAYGGFVSVIGYPLGTDIWGAWIVVHALVPLSIPAAVGIGVVVRWGREAFAARDGVGVAIAVALLLVSAGVSGVVMADSVYSNDQSEDNYLVQYAQPEGEMQDVLAAMDEAAAVHDGTDVVLYDTTGSIVKDDRATWDDGGLAKDPMCSQWHDILPLPWYFANSDAAVQCVIEPSALTSLTANETVPLIVTPGDAATVPVEDLGERYVSRTYRLRTMDTPITYWVSREYADQLRQAPTD